MIQDNDHNKRCLVAYWQYFHVFQGIVNWVKKRLGPAAEEVTDAKQLEKLSTHNELVVVGFFKELNGKDAKEFMRAASEDDEQIYVLTKEKELFTKYDIKGDSAVIMLTKFDEGRQDFDGKMKQNVKKTVKYFAINLLTISFLVLGHQQVG